MAGGAQDYGRALARAAAAECDLIVACAGSSAQFHPEVAVEPIIEGPRDKPVVAFFTPHAERSLALAAAAGIAAFRTPEACADAVAAFLKWTSPRELPRLAAPQSLPESPFELCASLGIPVAEWAIAQAPDFAHALGYPVAVKRLEAHKTERGGVVLGVGSRAEFDKAVGKLDTSRVLVQRMESGLAEAIVGYRDDAVVGPVVLVGAGGVMTEVYRDYVLRVAPVSEREAGEMIEQVKGFAAIRGFRNLPRGDVRALARAVSALSRLALARGRPVREAEVNPLMVKADGVVAVDALVARKEAA
jgi:acyl-CoA synthetase (NDP forming)